MKSVNSAHTPFEYSAHVHVMGLEDHQKNAMRKYWTFYGIFSLVNS